MICSCSGRNPLCVRCDGRGYYDPQALIPAHFECLPEFKGSPETTPNLVKPAVKEMKVMRYRKAANLGDPRGQHNLGVCYAKGEGVEKDAVEAVKWYRAAAVQGYRRAQFLLGFCFAFGNGVEKDAEKAVKWYREAAEIRKTE